MTEETIRWDIAIGPVEDYRDKPPACYIAEYPPLVGETSRQYFARVTPEFIMAQDRKTSRRWWQFWK